MNDVALIRCFDLYEIYANIMFYMSYFQSQSNSFFAKSIDTFVLRSLSVYLVTAHFKVSIGWHLFLPVFKVLPHSVVLVGNSIFYRVDTFDEV